MQGWAHNPGQSRTSGKFECCLCCQAAQDNPERPLVLMMEKVRLSDRSCPHSLLSSLVLFCDSRCYSLFRPLLTICNVIRLGCVQSLDTHADWERVRCQGGGTCWKSLKRQRWVKGRIDMSDAAENHTQSWDDKMILTNPSCIPSSPCTFLHKPMRQSPFDLWHSQ